TRHTHVQRLPCREFPPSSCCRPQQWRPNQSVHTHRGTHSQPCAEQTEHTQHTEHTHRDPTTLTRADRTDRTHIHTHTEKRSHTNTHTHTHAHTHTGEYCVVGVQTADKRNDLDEWVVTCKTLPSRSEERHVGK